MSPTTFARLARRVAPATLALVLVACDTTTPATPAPTATPAQTAAATLPIATPPPSAAPTPTPTPEPTAQTRPESTAPWTSFPSLLQARTDHSATALPDGRILVVGGETRQWDENDDVTTTTLASVEIYRPATGAWEKGPDLHVARSGHAAVLLKDGRVLVFGGGQATPTMMEDVPGAELFDPSSESWTTIEGPPGTLIVRKPIVLENGDVFFLVSVGDYPDHRLRPVIFDPATRTWRRGVRAPDIRIFPALAPLPDGSVLVSGGAFDVADGPPSPDSITWRYDISNDSWSKLAKTPLETVDWSGYAMPDGDVLLVGDGTPQRYHPATNSWTVLATPTVYRYIGGTIRLLDGRILGAGSNGCFDGSEESEIFDPVANTWTAAGSVAPGDGSTLVLLPDGRVAMVGGYWECQPYYVHELYPNVSVLDPSAIH